LIFLTVGNWHKGFDRLVEAVDRLRCDNVITEDVMAQIGSGSYRPENLNVIEYCSPTEFAEIMSDSRVVITHAGIGTIGQAIELAKPIIVVPRKAEIGECSDNHQWTTARQLEKEGKILVAYEICELVDRLKQAENFVPAREQGGRKIIHIVEKFLDELAAKKYVR
jgi:UDP-N-acetylglucosamine transferase subunit ALG13